MAHTTTKGQNLTRVVGEQTTDSSIRSTLVSSCLEKSPVRVRANVFGRKTYLTFWSKKLYLKCLIILGKQ